MGPSIPTRSPWRCRSALQVGRRQREYNHPAIDTAAQIKRRGVKHPAFPFNPVLAGYLEPGPPALTSAANSLPLVRRIYASEVSRKTGDFAPST